MNARPGVYAKEMAHPDLVSQLVHACLHATLKELSQGILNPSLLWQVSMVELPHGTRYRTPLGAAVSRTQEDADIVELLLTSRSDVRQSFGPNHTTALYVACQEGHTNVVERLLKHRASVHQANSDGTLPLHSACLKGHDKVVQQLLAHKAFDKGDHDGCTALHYASQQGHNEVVQRLLKTRAGVNQGNADGGLVALHYASQHGHERVVAQLLEYKATVDMGAVDGTTALHYASDSGHMSIAENLLKLRASVNKVQTSPCSLNDLCDPC